jgi:hypothetical protein
MVRFKDIKSIINTYIKTNGKEEITGIILQNVLRAMMDAVDFVVDEVVAAFPQITGSEFVDVLENRVSLLLDQQGHLGNTGRGLGVVMDKVMSDDSLNPVSNKVVKAYVDKIKSDIDMLIGGNLSSAIDNFNEILEFLSSIEDSETLSGIIAGLETALKKYADGVAQAAYEQSYSDSVGASSAYTDGKIAALAEVARTGSYNDLKDKPTIPDVSGAEVRTLFVNDAGLSADELSYNAETVQLIFAQHPMIFFASAEEGTPLSEYELMGMDNGRMVFAKYELDEYSTGATYIYLAMDGSTEVGGFSKSELDGDKYDSSLDADSVNAVQNKVVTENIRALEATMPLMAVIDLDAIIAQDTPIDNATRNALLELGGYTAGDKYFSKGWIWSRGYLYTIKVIPTDAGVQIHVLSLKGWCEILEDNSKVNHLPSQGGGSIEVDAELSEVSENAVSNKAVTMALAETEEVTAAALNELNKRFDDYATKEDLEDALADVSIEVDSAMSDTSENAVSNKVIKKYVDDADKSVKEYVDDADNTLSDRISALEQNSGGGNVAVDAELSESSTNAVANKAVTEAIVEDEEVISVALNQMNTRFDDYVPLDGLASEIQNAKDVIDASIIDNEEVAAAALVDLDKRLKDIIKILSNAGLIS